MEPFKTRFQYYANKSFHILGFIFWALIVINTTKNFQNRLFILFSAATIVLILLILFTISKTKINKLTNMQMYLILVFFVTLMFLGMAYTAYAMISTPLNDLGTVYNSIKEILEDGHIGRQINQYTSCGWSTHTSNNDYFVIYPNNQFILFFLLCYYRLLSLVGICVDSNLGNYMGCILNVFMISTSIVFGFFLCKKLWNNSGALMYLIFSFFFLPYYINSFRFYTDTLSLPFVVSSIFLFIKFREASSKKEKFIYSCLTGGILSFGILLKGSIYILLTAIIIYWILTIKNRQQVILLGIMLITCGSINFMWHQYIDYSGWIDNSAKNKLELPVTHWIMMASTGDGGFRQEDLDYTLSFPDKSAKKEATIEKTLERIRSKGIKEYLNFELMKIGISLADGKFAQNMHLSWYKKKSWIHDYVLEDGLHYKTFYNYTTIFIVALYLLIFLSFLFEIPKKEIGHGFFINLCMIGFLLFFMLWEVKSRYFLNYTPIYFMCSINALNNFTTLFRPIKQVKSP
ncbi:hypothetical protein [Mesobacillus foraminis]|uniref:hypothetical protein n=1 Tax=Mesobacillus foraminis TaxID=279826 RepID=UPI000EF451C7|nr:hypothetical protein [Mesobacillus foraminis]